MGFEPDWVEAQLAHEDKNHVRGSYNFAEYMSGRAQMMQQWADYQDALIADDKALISKLRKTT